MHGRGFAKRSYSILSVTLSTRLICWRLHRRPVCQRRSVVRKWLNGDKGSWWRHESGSGLGRTKPRHRFLQQIVLQGNWLSLVIIRRTSRWRSQRKGAAVGTPPRALRDKRKLLWMGLFAAPAPAAGGKRFYEPAPRARHSTNPALRPACRLTGYVQ
jgi:hypothetical protein